MGKECRWYSCGFSRFSIEGWSRMERRNCCSASSASDSAVQLGWKRRALQVWKKSLHLDRVVDMDDEFSVMRQAIAFVKSHNGRGDLQNLPLEMDEDTKLKISKMARKHPGVFTVTPTRKNRQEWVELTEIIKEVMEAERMAIQGRDEILSVNIVKKLLMMCKERRAPVKHLEHLKQACAFPSDFATQFVNRHPESFHVVKTSKGEVLELTSWDDSLAVTAREKSVKEGRTQSVVGPWAFVNTYPKKFKADRIFWEENDKFQRIPFPSPYEAPGRAANASTPSGEKRGVAMFHELLSLTIEKRAPLKIFHYLEDELQLPKLSDALLSCHPRIFYVSHKGFRGMAFLREAYRESIVKVKDPLVTIRNRYVGLLKIELKPKKQPKKIFDSDSESE